MRLFDFIFTKRNASASVAKERLQIVLAHERASRTSPDFLPRLQRDLLAVVAKYIAVKDEMIRIAMSKAGSASVLEINVDLPADAVRAQPQAAVKAGAAAAAASAKAATA